MSILAVTTREGEELSELFDDDEREKIAKLRIRTADDLSDLVEWFVQELYDERLRSDVYDQNYRKEHAALSSSQAREKAYRDILKDIASYAYDGDECADMAKATLANADSSRALSQEDNEGVR